MQISNSIKAFAQAQKSIPGGVNSPVRSFKGVGGNPIFIDSADGAYITDIDGQIYIDYVGSWGPMILGHNAAPIRNAIISAAEKGISFGAPTQLETQLAEKMLALMPSMDKVRFVNSGTEATMSALRLARAYSGRDIIVKFEGCYHGHADALLVKGGSGMLTLGQPSSPGVPVALAELTATLEYNNTEALETFFAEKGHSVGAVIIEPVAGNMNCIPATVHFLQTLRELCTQHNVVLIFDEVMSGFRVSLGGAQSIYGISPDLTCLGKIIGGGMPVGAFGGRADIMELLAPLGSVYQAGTLSGNPLCMAAGLAMMDAISAPGFYETLTHKTEQLCAGLLHSAKQAGVDMQVNQRGAMFGLFIGAKEAVTRFNQVGAGVDQYNQFFHAMLEYGVYMAPSAYEAGFVSAAHGEREIEQTLQAAQKALAKCIKR